MSEEDAEIERIKQQRFTDSRRRAVEEEARTRAESEKQNALRIVLTPEARQRLTNVKMVRPDFAEQLELQLIQLAQTGKIPIPVTDAYLRDLLNKLTSRKRDISIRRV
ncbi:MAG: DNA-binding protein [Candidatus Bathyarchaeia archaeon]